MNHLRWAVLVVVIVGAAAWGQQQTPAQDTPATMQAVLQGLTDDGTLYTIEFNTPVARLGRSVNIGDGTPLTLQRAGTDMLCLRAPASSATQVTCIPYSNVNAVFYAE